MRSIVAVIFCGLLLVSPAAAQDDAQDPPLDAEAPPLGAEAPPLDAEAPPVDAEAPPLAAGDRVERARVAFEAGTFAYEQGDLLTALARFEETHALVGSRDVLFNIGVVAERLGRVDRAIEAFEVYVRDALAADRAAIETRLARLRARRDREPRGRPGEPAVAPEESGDSGTSETAPGDASPGNTSRGPTFLWTFVAAGVAAAAGLASALFWVDANSADGELAAACTAGCSRETLDASRGPTMVTLTNAFLVAALIGAAATVVVFFVELTGSGSEGSSSLALGVGPGSLTVEGAW